MAKDKRINVRLSEDLRKKVEEACDLTGLDEPTLIRACLEAFADHVKQKGGIWLPLAIVPKSQATAGAEGGPSSERHG